MGLSTPTYTVGTWTPIDSSGATLTFTGVAATWTRIGNLVIAQCALTYPSTANGTGNLIGGLPFTVANSQYARQGVLSFTNSTAANAIPTNNDTTITVYTATGTQLSNAQMSTNAFYITAIYTTV